MGEYFIYVAKDSTLTNPKATTDTGRSKRLLIAVQKKVMPGQTVGADVIIKTGIKAGDRIVVDGLQSLHDGSLITTKNKVPPAGGKKR
jgi:membrane fusion protein (multidrug efflux system)